jgi:cytochrome c556
MIGFVIKAAIVVVIGVLAWNYFFGTSEEKAQSAKTFGQMKEVAVSVGELAKSEKEKYDAGKYDAALDKLGATYKKLREGARKMDASLLKRIDDLEQRKRELRQELDDIQKTDTASNPQAERKAELGRELERLRLDSDTLVKESGGK